MPFVATWMNLEIITLREVSPTDKNIMAYVEFEKKDTNKLIYRTKTDTQTSKTNL